MSEQFGEITRFNYACLNSIIQLHIWVTKQQSKQKKKVSSFNHQWAQNVLTYGRFLLFCYCKPPPSLLKNVLRLLLPQLDVRASLYRLIYVQSLMLEDCSHIHLLKVSLSTPETRVCLWVGIVTSHLVWDYVRDGNLKPPALKIVSKVGYISCPACNFKNNLTFYQKTSTWLLSLLF